MAAILPIIATAAGTTSALATTGSTLATIASIASGVAGIGSTLFSMQASSQQNAAEQASVQYNAAVERLSSAQQERQLRREQYLRAGTQLATAGASGAGLNGNVIDIMADTAYQSELDILGIRTASQLSQAQSSSKLSALKSSAKYSTVSSILGSSEQTSKSVKGIAEGIKTLVG